MTLPVTLPSPQELLTAMTEGRCVVERHWCRTHDSSLLMHDGGRVACLYAWERAL